MRLAVLFVLCASVAQAQTATHGFTIPAGSTILDPILHADSKTALCARYAGATASYPLVGTTNEARMAYQAFLYACTGTYTASNGGAVDTTGEAETTLLSGTYTCGAGAGMYNTSTGYIDEDNSRYFGDYAILSFVWLYDQLSAGERDTLIACFNRVVAVGFASGYGGASNVTNNYHWAYQRNGLLWAIASYRLTFTQPAFTVGGTECEWHPPGGGGVTIAIDQDICGLDQVDVAELFLDQWEARWDNLVTDMIARPGGIPGDGTHYGPYMWGYYTPMILSAHQYGRTLLTESVHWWEAAGYHILYGTSPKMAYHNFSAASAYQLLPYGENNLDSQGGRVEISDGNIAAMMTLLAWAYDGTTQEPHVRKWLTDHNPDRVAWIKVFDPDLGAAGTALTALPLDLYAPGVGYLYAHSTWSNGVGDDPLLLHLQLGTNAGNHIQADPGNWQAFHDDRMFQETVTYVQPVADYLGTGHSSGQASPWPHNTVVCNNQASWTAGSNPVVRSLTRHADFVHAVTDLRGFMGISTGICATADRGFVFIRDMKTLVVLDRADRASGATPLTALLHCPTNPPAVSSNIWTCTNDDEVMRVLLYSCEIAGQTCGNTEIDESAIPDADCPGADCQWQYRLQHQVTTSSAGVAYTIQIIQWLSSGDAEVAATVTDGSPFTIALTMTGASNTTISVPKGTTWASGGSITIGSTTTNFGSTVMTPTVTAAAGVTWDEAAPAGTPTRFNFRFRAEQEPIRDGFRIRPILWSEVSR